MKDFYGNEMCPREFHYHSSTQANIPIDINDMEEYSWHPCWKEVVGKGKTYKTLGSHSNRYGIVSYCIENLK